MTQFDHQGLKILLSHHRSDQLHLCYALGPVHLCARCSGLYPGLFLAFLLGLWTGPWPVWLDWTLLLLAPLPAFIDWGLSTALGKPERANWLRTLTGFGLGVGIGANLAYNTRDLLGRPVVAQLVFFMAALWLIWMISYSRRSRVRREKLTQRLQRPSLEEFVFGKPGEAADGGEGEGPAGPGDQDHKPQAR